MTYERKPRITMMGEEIPWDEFPDAARATELEDYFKPVRISPQAINQVSMIVPSEYWIKQGLHSWISARANYVFSKLSGNEREGKLKQLKYFFEFDADGPVLSRVVFIAI